MTDRTDLAAPLGSHLTDAARSFDIPAGDLDAVVSRGGRRVRRRRRAVAGVAAVALVTGAAGAVDLLGGTQADVSVSSGSSLVRGEVGIVWRAVSPSSGLGPATGPGSGTGTAAPLYALSTAPGQARVGSEQQRVVWRSDDGVEWTAVSALAQDLYLSDLSSRDGRVYAVGTGPATAAVGRAAVSPLLVGWSDDGGRTWEREPLPIDLEALSDRTSRVAMTNTAVAAGADATVVSAVLAGTLDVPRVLPAGVTAPNGWAVTATGVDLLGPEREVVCPEGTSAPEVTKAHRLVQLEAGGAPPGPDGGGVPAETVRGAGTGGEPGQVPGEAPGEVMPTTCLREEGAPVEITPQDARGVEASYTWDQLGVEGDLLRAVRRQPVAFVAPHGSNRFERVDLPAVGPVEGPVLLDADDHGFDLVATTTASPDRTHGGRAPGIVALHSEDGHAWAGSSTAPDAQVWATTAGRVGGVATIVGQGPGGAVVVRADGAGGWTTTPLAGALATGVPDGADVYLTSAAIGPFGIVATVAVEPEEGTGGPSGPEQRVLVSRDARTWEDRSVAELAGRPVRGVMRVSIVGERAVIAVTTPSAPGQVPGQVVLVGTPD